MNALLSWAALIDGVHALSYDQTGAAQKWGPVLSSLILSAHDQTVAANRVGLGRADLYLALDLLAAGSRVNLDRCDPARTVAVVNSSVLPSGEMVRNVDFAPPVDAIRAQIDRFTRAGANVAVDARWLAEGLFGDYLTTNMLVLGVAYQAGLLPLTRAAIEEAIRLNGVAVEQNLQAFRYGRLWRADPDRVRALVEPPARSFDTERAAALERFGGRDAGAYVSLLDRCAHLDPEARRMLALRVGELIDYQDGRYAAAYVAFVLEVAAREEVVAPGRREVTHAVIRNLYKLMAYKDEYEVARLHLKPAFRAGTLGLFAAPRRVAWHLHPPFLRALGLRRKLRLGPWFRHPLGALRALRRLRGTPFDPFGYAAVRREERRLIPWYRDLVAGALADADGHDAALALARLPEWIRGYEDIKLRSIAKVRGQALTSIQSTSRSTS
jgi:indolepyruvate ferredoxin oxidoreductase